VSWSVLLPLGFTLVAWWASTAGILYLVKLPRHTHRWTMLAGTLALPVLLYAVATAGGESARGPAAAYVAFTAALLVWGWQELAFLLGYVTGPRRLPCPDDISRGRRVALAIEVVLHHELALLVLGVAVFLLSPPDGGRVAWWTFAALWLMRLSAKLNLFLGARNPQEHLLPPHLAYLGSYFRRRPMNRLFPWSIGLSLLAIAILGGAAFGHGASEHDRTALLLVTALVALGALEHGLMMVPTRSARPHILP
jgi:putative photosynthetic complex assembly protein 2